MRTRKKSSSGTDTSTKPIRDSESRSSSEFLNDNGTLAEKSQEAVGKLLRRSNKRGSRGTKKNDNNLQQCDLSSRQGSGSEKDDKQDIDSRVKLTVSEADGCSRDTTGSTLREDKVEETLPCNLSESRADIDDLDWEDGSIPSLDPASNEVTIEFNETPDSVRRKPIRRVTAEDKEIAEIVHKVHLLCLLGRGRLIDRACDDSLIQAALLSLLPRHLLNISMVAKLTAKDLHPLILWFRDNFHVRSLTDVKMSFHSALAHALETCEGTSEEIAALSVALFRALNLTTRFVSILDVTSLKPDGEKSDYFSQDASRSCRGIFSNSTPMVARQSEVSASLGKSFSPSQSVYETSQRSSCTTKDCHLTDNTQHTDFPTNYDLKTKHVSGDCSLAFESKHDSSEACLAQKSQGSKRKGDLEFELQMEMALSSTAVGNAGTKIPSVVNNSGNSLSAFSSHSKRMKKIVCEESCSNVISTAIGSKRVGSPLYWAEVHCNGENLTGKWVHVDAINAIIDGEQKVEAVAAACKTSLRYAVAFAGNGAKDVTRRYCMQWYKIASKRVNSIWWDAVLAPLRDIESRATGGMVLSENDHVDSSFNPNDSMRVSENLKDENLPNNPVLLGKSGLEVLKDFGERTGVKSSLRNSLIATRSSLEDMELETRALTEPLPTNQQAYKNHHLYAIEKWLNKYQVLHPKGPILGYCSGHPVYPRACVQTLKTKERWLREALQVKVNELPVKESKYSRKLQKVKSFEDDDCARNNSEGTLELYGKWQLEPLQLPHAVNGLVPKNERGQVDVWSEKCLPPGTVHLRLPRVFSIAKELEIDYAPAMVGFEFRNGQSYPVFDGIVVCAEFRDVILEAYRGEQERKEAEEKKRNEREAISHWYQLLSSIVTRKRIKDRYGKSLSSQASTDIKTASNISNVHVSADQAVNQSFRCQEGDMDTNKLGTTSTDLPEEHQHVFLTEDQCFDEENLVLTKRCHCGFSIEVEEL
ncbi:DNA repair protein RAD4 isoform X1 [Cannabis sativa]|uniref:DNA repair protein RAD4 isoform X1 n=1 Tax=Cannabis sativa TaxID=3483 RepID=UPI0029CA7484|nr:DNA repair protein RAD4 isoform X1 [Cannabis sativa]